MSHEWVTNVIEGGDYRVLDSKAKALGESLGASKTQVRTVFGTVKRLETLHGLDLKRDLVLLRPRLAYSAARTPGLAPLADVLGKASELADSDDDKELEARVQRLVDLMEAILCYSRA